MESKDELKDIDIKNYSCYNLDDEIKYKILILDVISMIFY